MRYWHCFTALVMTLALSLPVALAQPLLNTGFTYQGQLKKDGLPVNLTCQMEFSLWNSPAGGSQLGATQVIPDVEVNDGLFTVILNAGGEFGPNAFLSDDRWLEITVHCPDSVTLVPRQPLTGTPFSLQTRGIVVSDDFNVELHGNLFFANDDTSITFPPTAGNTPMIHMFSSGTFNDDRMVLAHSPAFPTWGLQYRDSVDRFDFLRGGQPVMTVDLTGRRVGIGTLDPVAQLDIHGAAGNNDNIQIRKSGDLGPDNVRFVLSHRTEGTELWMYGTDGASGFRNLQGWDYGNNRAAFPANGDTLVVDMNESRVGMGTTSPSAPLHVVRDSNNNAIRSDGTLRVSKGVGESGPGISVFKQISTFPVFSSSTLEIDGARLDAFGTFVGVGTSMHLNSTSEGNVLLGNGGGNVGIGTTSPSLRLSIVDSGVGFSRPATNALGLYTDASERVRINSAGNMGVGTTSPNTRLHVNGPSDGHAFRAQVAGLTKLLVSQTGGVSVGANVSSPPTNGLYVSGNVGLGTTSPAARLHVVGTTRTNIIEISGADLAEEFPFSEDVGPGLVVMIDADHPGKLCMARGEYNRRVAGIVAGANDFSTGVVLGRGSGNGVGAPVALSGRVYVWCDASGGAIEPGDMLTTSETPGHAMKVNDFARAQGAILGKAMTPLAEAETGLVLVLVNLQ